MPEAHYKIGETFPAQFAWQLPNGDYLRAVFDAEVLGIVDSADKYVVRLLALVAGRQEDEEGTLKPTAEFSKEYWGLVGKLVGRRLTIAFEADDGHAIHFRLATLTGEHNYFYRFPD